MKYEKYYIFDNFKKYNCLAAFSSGRLNLAVSDNPDFEKNKRIFLRSLNIAAKNIIYSKQVHGSKVLVVTKKERASLDNVSGYDAIITQEKQLGLAVFTADCLSIFILDAKNMVAAIAHAGWRGARDNIVSAVLGMFRDRFSSRMENIICGFGPSIRSCCYEVGSEFENHFCEGLIKRNGRIFLDLIKVNSLQLVKAGVLKDNISDSGFCTSCQCQDFFSYRKDGPCAGRMISLIMIK